MRFRTEGTSSGDFFIKEARVSDNDRKNLQTEYYNAKRAAELYHPIHGNIAPPPVKYTGKTIQFHNLLGYETLIPALFLTDNSIRHSSAELVEKMGTILAMVHDCDSENQSRTEFPSSFPIPIDKYLHSTQLCSAFSRIYRVRRIIQLMDCGAASLLLQFLSAISM